MNYYPAWFDYAGWIFAGAGALCAFAMMPQPASRKRGFLKLAACLLAAIGIGFGATGGILFNLRAPHLTVQGNLSEVTRHQERHGYSTSFELLSASGAPIRFAFSSGSMAIADGEAAEVEYQAGSYEMLYFRVIKGSYAGYEWTGQDGMLPAAFWAFAALVLAMYGTMGWLSDSTATASQPDNRDAPDGDVDTKSLLDLSSRD